MTIEQQLQLLASQVNAIASREMVGYYTSRWLGEEIDALLGGKSLVIRGVYASLAALKAAFPNGAEGAYQISSTKDLYVWNAKTKAWENIGPMQGPAGKKGTTFYPAVSIDGVLSWTNDGDLANPQPTPVRGNGIQSIVRTSGTGAPGTRDTYTITMTDGTKAAFTVYNGADGNIADTEAARQAAIAASAAKAAAELARDRAEQAAQAAETDQEALDQAVASARKDAAAAGYQAGQASSSALLSQSWAEGGTGVREDEEVSNSKYWANRAQAYAEQTSHPAVVQGVYNYILEDRDTGERYALLVESGTLKLLGVPDTMDAADMALIDTVTGTKQQLIVESGTLKLLEVE